MKFIQRNDMTHSSVNEKINRIYEAMDKVADNLRFLPKYEVLYHQGLDIAENTHSVIYIPFPIGELRENRLGIKNGYERSMWADFINE